MTNRATIFWVQAAIASLLMAPAIAHLGVALPGKPGLADLPGTINFHWVVQSFGLSSAGESDWLMYPAKMDRILLDGIPLDAFASWPFTAAFGWPAGFTLYVWATLLVLGLSTSWLSTEWFKSSHLAWLAGGVAQTHPFLIRELADGRSTQIFAAVFVPLCFVFAIRSIRKNCVRSAAFSGLFWGLSTLAYWFNGAFIGLGLVGILFIFKPPQFRLILATIGTLFATVSGSLLRVLKSDAEMPGKGLQWSDTVIHGDHPLPLWQLIEFRDLGATIASDRVLAAQLLLFCCCAYGLVRKPRERWLLPFTWVFIALAFAAGPKLGWSSFSVPGPFTLFDLTDWTRRLWWPERALVLAIPGTALLTVLGAQALIEQLKIRPAILAIVLLAESFWVIPGLPIQTTWGDESTQSAQLAQGAGPVLILPMGSGGTQPNARMLIDQIHHGRPLINGPMPYTSSTAPTAYQDHIKSETLSGLIACEVNPQQAPRSSPWDHLQKLGVEEVYLDIELAQRLPHGVAVYQACIDATLGQPTLQQNNLAVYRPSSL